MQRVVQFTAEIIQKTKHLGVTKMAGVFSRFSLATEIIIQWLKNNSKNKNTTKIKLHNFFVYIINK
jgi:hypothetical protein